MSTELVRYSTRGRVAVISFANPPVNSLGFELRRALAAAIERMQADNHRLPIERKAEA